VEDKLEKLKKESNLSDIILEKDSSGGDKTKKYLLIAASSVLLFLIVLIVLKMFNNTDISQSENLAGIGDSIEQKSQEVADKSINAFDEAKNTLFKEEPIIDESSETDLKFEEMVRKLKQQDAEENREIVAKEENKIDITQEKEENVLNKIKEVTTAPVKVVQEKIVTKVEKVEEALKPSRSTPIVETVAISTPKEVIISTKQEYTPISSPISSMSGYFIQVGATAKSFPDRRFLTKIKNSGFDYIVHKVVIKGKDIKKVLIGPYETRAEARNNLNNVQSMINPSAYIYRIK